MAGLLDSFVQGYMSRMGGRGNSSANEAMQAQNTASAYQRLQDAISQDYSQQKAQAQAQGQEWKMPSATERMNDQVQAMILSGDPNLQARGLAMLDVPKEDEQSSLEKTAALLGLTPMQVFDKLHPGAASTRVNVNIPKQEQMVSIEDSQKIVMPDGSNPPVGSTYSWVAANGGKTVKTKEQADSSATGEVIEQGVHGMQNVGGKTTTDPLPAAIAEYRNMPGVLGDVLNTSLNVAGIKPNPADTAFMTSRNQVAMNITRLMSGAAASDQDVARVTNMLPKLTDDPSTRATKMKAAMAQAKAYVEAARQKGGAAPTAAAAKAEAVQPVQRVTKSGVKYTVE